MAHANTNGVVITIIIREILRLSLLKNTEVFCQFLPLLKGRIFATEIIRML